MNRIDVDAVNALRVLAADEVQKANSGHPGLPLGAAPAAYTVWAYEMKHNPKNYRWENRDRFILSGGHGSALLYALLHLFGYGLTKNDLENFRQLDSLTPGHPEYGHTVGVEATTGPLGAGMGMAVGMAIAEAHLSAVFNRPGYDVVDHYTFVLGGDGCLMEGISSEAFSLAGTLKLSKLIVLYDSNRISIEGSTDIAFTEDVGKRMEAFGFQVLTVEDGNDVDAIRQAIQQAKADKERPSFIVVKTQIGQGCPAKQGTAAAHGEPLGEQNIQEMKKGFDWPSVEPFFVPEEIYAHYQTLTADSAAEEARWNEMMEAYKNEFPELKAKWETYHYPLQAINTYNDDSYWEFEDKPQATRNLSGVMINRLKDILPNLIGGAADLAPSTKTYMKGEGDFSSTNRAGRNLHFGVRELAMAAIANGIALHGGLRPYVSTFFVFSDYVKPMARLSALMKLPVTYVFTHDSIGVGEDGPTHEPIEQLAMLRGGYILQDSEKEVPDAILIATGSEVQLAVAAKAALAEEGIDVRVVSMPSMDVFDRQVKEYQEKVLPNAVRKRVAIEALSGFGWGKYVGLDGKVVAMPGFGASAPANLLFEKFGFTVDNVVATVKSIL